MSFKVGDLICIQARYKNPGKVIAVEGGHLKVRWAYPPKGTAKVTMVDPQWITNWIRSYEDVIEHQADRVEAAQKVLADYIRRSGKARDL